MLLDASLLFGCLCVLVGVSESVFNIVVAAQAYNDGAIASFVVEVILIYIYILVVIMMDVLN